MCGIVGFNWKGNSLVKKMTNAVKHRGPDGEGHYFDKNISLGHRRLAILDLSEKGNQPMKYEDYFIVFNGEIYNFKEIREELKDKGHQFTSETDTEVILHAYDEWGSECVKKFNGMWAFCIYDKERNRLFLSRDRFGIKPLYYYFKDDKFIFASELKAIKEHKIDLSVNKKALNYFFYQKYVGEDLTIYDDCFKLKAGNNLFFDLKRGELSIEEYYKLQDEINECNKLPLTERLSKIESILKDAVDKRLIADVPVGSFLSGGVDSSLISAIIASEHEDFRTFSIGFKNESFDELPFSKKVSEYIGTSHYYDYLEVDENVIELVLSNLDEPFGDASILPTYLLSKITRKKVTVALSGDSGDEVFGGYDSYQGYYLSKFIPDFSLPFLKFFANLLPSDNKKLSFSFKVKRFVRDYSSDVIKRHSDWMSTFNNEMRKKLLRDDFSSDVLDLNYSQDLRGIQLHDINNYMREDILKKVDTASMLNSLEVRVPFLDYRLVPLVLSLPERYKIRFFETKYFLKKLAEDYLPNDIVYRKKKGFTVPIAKWIKTSDLIQEYLTKNKYYTHKFLNYAYVQELYEEHIDDENDNSRELWLIFVFNYWWKNGR